MKKLLISCLTLFIVLSSATIFFAAGNGTPKQVPSACRRTEDLPERINGLKGNCPNREALCDGTGAQNQNGQTTPAEEKSETKEETTFTGPNNGECPKDNTCQNNGICRNNADCEYKENCPNDGVPAMNGTSCQNRRNENGNRGENRPGRGNCKNR